MAYLYDFIAFVDQMDLTIGIMLICDKWQEIIDCMSEKTMRWLIRLA